MSRNYLRLYIAVLFFYSALAQSVPIVSISGGSGSAEGGSVTTTGPFHCSLEASDWYQPAVYGPPQTQRQNDCLFTAFQWTAPTTGQITFTVTKSVYYSNFAPAWYTNSAYVGMVGGVSSITSDPLCSLSYLPHPQTYLIDATVTFQAVQHAQYCIFIGESVPAGTDLATSIVYGLVWSPAPPAPPEGTNGPLPLWAYGLLALAFLFIARRRLVRA